MENNDIKVGDFVKFSNAGKMLYKVVAVYDNEIRLHDNNIYNPCYFLKVEPKYKIGEKVKYKNFYGLFAITEINISKCREKFIYNLHNENTSLLNVPENGIIVDETICEFSVGDYVSNGKFIYKVKNIYKKNGQLYLDVLFEPNNFVYFYCEIEKFTKVKENLGLPIKNTDGYYHWFFSAQEINGENGDILPSGDIFRNIRPKLRTFLRTGFSINSYKVIDRNGTPGVLFKFTKNS